MSTSISKNDSVPKKEDVLLLAFKNLHPKVHQFLSSKETCEQFLKLLNNFQISSSTPPESDDFYSDFEVINSIVGDVDLGLLKLSELLPELINEMRWPEDKAKKFACELAGFRYLPVSEFMKEDVAGQIKGWGGDLSKYPAKKIGTQKIYLDKLLDLIINDLKNEVYIPEKLVSRFKFLITSRIKGIRDDLELKTLLTRPEKIGGTEIFEEDADFIVEYLKSKRADFEIIGDSTPPTPPPTEKPSAKEALPAAQKFMPPAPLSTLEREMMEEADSEPAASTEKTDEDEISQIKSEMSTKILLPQNGLKASVENIVKTIKNKIPKELVSRFQSIVDARLRDLRDNQETKNLLVASTDRGGLALPPEKAAAITNLIEAEFLALQNMAGAAQTKEFSAFQKTLETAHATKQTTTAQKEKDVLDRRYLETIGKSRTLKEKKPITPPSLSDKPRQSDLKPITYNLKPVLSPASLPSQKNKPLIEDVKFARKTLGPIDELRAMTIVEFRRLSRDPKEAILKIHDKIELLKEESYGKYVQAVRAWQAGEPNRLYLEMMRAALQTGNPVTSIISERAATNEPGLSQPEFQAIMSLNSELRF